LGNFKITQEQTWAFNDMLTHEGEGVRKISEWIKGESLVAVRNGSFVEYRGSAA